MAMTLFVRIARVSGFMLDRSFPASSGAASIAHRDKWVRFSSSVNLPLPTSSMSGSFQCPGPANLTSPACGETMLTCGLVCGDVAGGAPKVATGRRSPTPKRHPSRIGRSCRQWGVRDFERLPHVVVGGVHQAPSAFRSRPGACFSITSGIKLHRSYFR